MRESKEFSIWPRGSTQPVSVVMEMQFTDQSACVRFFKDATCKVELVISHPYRAHIRSAGCDLASVTDVVTYFGLSDIADGCYVEQEAAFDLPCTAIFFDQPHSARWACFGKHALNIAQANVAKIMN